VLWFGQPPEHMQSRNILCGDQLFLFCMLQSKKGSNDCAYLFMDLVALGRIWVGDEGISESWLSKLS